MKIIAMSDLHGNLIHVKDRSDAVVIAGDWSPMYIQHDYNSMIKWINDRFMPWLVSLHTDNIIFIAGNHDLVCKYSYFNDDLSVILKRHSLTSKVHYLNRSAITINNIKFYGIPDTEGPYTHWAFMKPNGVNYTFDKDTNVLITHQPPNVGLIGYVSEYNKNLGSANLFQSIHHSNLQLNLCGHIHTGSHSPTNIRLSNGKYATCYNVSILDEDYHVAYDYTTVYL